MFVVEASQVTEMLEANVIAPYKFRKVSSLDASISSFIGAAVKVLITALL